MNRTAQDRAEPFAGVVRPARQCKWLSIVNLALVVLCAARVYELI